MPNIELPDCPHCDAAETLKPVRADFAGSMWCECSCCAKQVLVKEGRVVHARFDPQVDVSGVPMFDP